MCQATLFVLLPSVHAFAPLRRSCLVSRHHINWHGARKDQLEYICTRPYSSSHSRGIAASVLSSLRLLNGINRVPTRGDGARHERSAGFWSCARLHTVEVTCALQDFGFKTYTPGSLQHSDVDWCEGSHEPSEEELRSIPESTKVLFIAGAQKAGTTWLFNALDKHPTFVGASHAYKCDPSCFYAWNVLSIALAVVQCASRAW